MSELAIVRAAVVGAGPVGLVSALLLAAQGVRTALIAPSPGTGDSRTAGLFAGSVALLRNLGVWDGIAAQCAPITGIRIVDSQNHLLRAPETLFSAAEQGLEVFGFNVPNAVLTRALFAAAERQGCLTVIPQAARHIACEADGVTVTLDDGATVRADAIVGADGRHSLARSAAGIATTSWDYPQAAVVTTFAHQRPHRGISTEFHRANGPMTTVPMPQRRSSLVWVESRDEAARLTDLAEPAFRDDLERGLAGLLGSLSDFSPRRTFPLSGLSADVMGRGLIGLVGEAAHVMPPIGAQGLNLGLRDAAALAERIADAPPGVAGVRTAIEQYADDRKLDVASRIAAIDALNRSLLTGLLPVHLMRGLGLYALNASQALRRVVVREGLQPSLALPRSMQPDGLASRSASTTAAGITLGKP